MAALVIFGVLVVVGFIALVAIKVRWARQGSRKWAAAEADREAPKV